MNASSTLTGAALNIVMASRLSLYSPPDYADGAFNDSYRITFTTDRENVREIFMRKVVAQKGTRWGFAARSKAVREAWLDTEEWLVRDNELL